MVQENKIKMQRHLKLAAVLLACFAFHTYSCAWVLLEVPSTDIVSSRGNLNSSREQNWLLRQHGTAKLLVPESDVSGYGRDERMNFAAILIKT